MLTGWGTALRRLRHADEGQDLVEYALVGALLGLAAVAAMQKIATGISTALTHVSTTLSTAI